MRYSGEIRGSLEKLPGLAVMTQVQGPADRLVKCDGTNS